MALPLVIILVSVLLFIVINFDTIKRVLKFRKIDKTIHGPPIDPIFGNVSQFRNKTTAEISQLFVTTAQNARKKGKSLMKFRILDKVLVWPLDGKTLSKLLESTTELNKGDDYRFFDPWFGKGVLTVDGGERWRSHRKLLTPTFHFAKLEGYLEVFNSESKIMIECLEKFADSGETVDLFRPFKMCTLDIICATAMGVKIDAQLHHNHPYVQAVEGFNNLAIHVAVNPFLKIPLVAWALGYKKQKEDYLKTLKSFTGGVIAERRAAIASGEIEKETSKRKMNFLDILLNSEESNMLSEDDLRHEVDTFMFAGHDTTTGSISWLCWNMAHNQDIQQKVYEELVGIFGEDPNGDVTTELLSKLDYTERVIKESKRRIAPVPGLQRKLINDMELDGVTVPSGSNVIIGPLVLHSNPEAFPDPEKFDPDRFLPDEMAKRNPYDFVPFSAGARNCIGQKFAQMNEKVMFIYLMRNFKIEPMGGFYSTRPTFEAIAKPSHGIPVKLIRRF